MSSLKTTVTMPKDNHALMKAVYENRVATVFQNPAGNKKDFGIIGFHQEKFASYLVFPQRLPKLGDVHIIGIKYELLQEGASNRHKKRVSESPKERRENSSPHMSNPVRNGFDRMQSGQKPKREFQVKILRTGIWETTLILKAKTISEAEATALEKVKTHKFEPVEIHNEVKSITEN